MWLKKALLLSKGAADKRACMSWDGYCSILWEIACSEFFLEGIFVEHRKWQWVPLTTLQCSDLRCRSASTTCCHSSIDCLLSSFQVRVSHLDIIWLILSSGNFHVWMSNWSDSELPEATWNRFCVFFSIKVLNRPREKALMVPGQTERN